MSPNNKIFNEQSSPIFSTISNGTETMDIEDDAGVTIDFAHAKIHEGVSYSVTKLFQGVANNGYADLRILTGSTYESHLLIEIAADGKSYIFLYRGTTYSNSGTSVTAYNLNDGSTNTTASSVYYSPTISNSGTLLDQDLMPAGKGTKIVGGEYATRAERILRTSTGYLLRVQNVSAASGDISINFTYYELID